MSEQASLPAAGGLLSLNLSMLPQGAQSAAAGNAGLFTGFSTMLSQQGGAAGQPAEFANGQFLPPQTAALPLQTDEQLSEQELFNQRLLQMAQLLEQKQSAAQGDIPEEISAELARALRQYTEQQPVLTPEGGEAAAEAGAETEAEAMLVSPDQTSAGTNEPSIDQATADAEQAGMMTAAVDDGKAAESDESARLPEAQASASSDSEAQSPPSLKPDLAQAAASASPGVAAEQARMNARAAEVARQGERAPGPLQADAVKQVPAAGHSAAVQIHGASNTDDGAEAAARTSSGQFAAASSTQGASVVPQDGQSKAALAEAAGSNGQSVNEKPVQPASIARQPAVDAESDAVAKQDATTARTVTQLAEQSVVRTAQSASDAEVDQELAQRSPVELKTPQKFEAALDMTRQLLQKMAAAEKSDSSSSSIIDKPAAAVTAAGQSLAQPSQAQKVVTEAQNLMMPQQVRMNTPAWNNALGERAVMIATQNSRVAEIQLDPPELGSLSVRVNVNQDQVSLSFSSPHAHVRDAVEQSLPRLREMFAEQGLALQDSSVSDHSSEQQSREQMAGESQGQGQYADGAVAGESEQAVNTRARPVSLVDYYA
ncbi:flagellar hook-length control protein FliK [Neptuniibacter halophilus]|uniref:flagellar hook-length control protein FliK n=1 Tax=Neptuniibacter halophilus TaxID=651666 RepID=UPI0025722199|nr:flagellar hook-length control protein FliK [Neptuniibacter halophilus]